MANLSGSVKFYVVGGNGLLKTYNRYMHRYFIGLSLPQTFSQQTARLQHELYDQGVMLHPLVPHITLLPPQAASSLDPDKFRRQLRHAAEPLLPLKIELTDVGTFGERVVFVSVHCDKLSGLYETATSLLPEKIRAGKLFARPYTPHLTLAQAKQFQTLPAPLIHTFRAQARTLLPQSLTLQQLTMFRQYAPRRYAAEPL